MALDQELKRDQSPETLSPAEMAPTPAAESSTKFTAGGKIPDVAPTATKAPTASELAFEKGPGVKALEELIAKGPAEPDKVVDLIDAHRGETAAMFTLLESKLGAGYAGQVREAMDFRISIKRKEVVAGDPTNENGGYFLASADQKGAKWRTKNGGFKGTAGENGLDSTVRVDDNDQIHANVDKKGNGTVAWEHDGKSVGELYRADNEMGARKNFDLGEDGKATAGVRHRSHDGTATDEAYGTYATKDGKLSTDAALGVNNGSLAAMAGATYKPSAGDTYSGRINHDAAGTKLTASGTHELGKDESISGSGELFHHADGSNSGNLSATYKPNANDSYGAAVNHDANGTKFTANGSHLLGNGSTLSGSGELFHHANGTNTGSLSGAYDNKDRRLDASITRNADSTNFHVGDTEKTLAPNLTVNGSLDYLHKDSGAGQTTLHLGERYRSGNMIHGLDLDVGRGERNYLNATGSLDARLAPNLYGGAFGGVHVEDGKQTTGQLGASLTFTPHEKAALTLAGVLDNNGSLETRLQLDVFKSKIEGVSTIADHKKDALVSLFVSYTTAGNRMMDDRYGAPSMTMPVNSDRVMAGIKINF